MCSAFPTLCVSDTMTRPAMSPGAASWPEKPVVSEELFTLLTERLSELNQALLGERLERDITRCGTFAGAFRIALQLAPAQDDDGDARAYASLLSMLNGGPCSSCGACVGSGFILTHLFNHEDEQFPQRCAPWLGMVRAVFKLKETESMEVVEGKAVAPAPRDTAKPTDFRAAEWEQRPLLVNYLESATGRSLQAAHSEMAAARNLWHPTEGTFGDVRGPVRAALAMYPAFLDAEFVRTHVSGDRRRRVLPHWHHGFEMDLFAHMPAGATPSTDCTQMELEPAARAPSPDAVAPSSEPAAARRTASNARGLSVIRVSPQDEAKAFILFEMTTNPLERVEDKLAQLEIRLAGYRAYCIAPALSGLGSSVASAKSPPAAAAV